MEEKEGEDDELTENTRRDQRYQAFEKDRDAVKTLLSLIDVDKDDFENQRKLTQSIFDLATFETSFRMASNDDFRAVSKNPRVPEIED